MQDKLQDTQVACGFSSLVWAKEKKNRFSCQHTLKKKTKCRKKDAERKNVNAFFPLSGEKKLETIYIWMLECQSTQNERNIFWELSMHRLFNHWPKTCSCEINLVADETSPSATRVDCNDGARKISNDTKLYTVSHTCLHFMARKFCLRPFRYYRCKWYFCFNIFFSLSHLLLSFVIVVLPKKENQR